MAEPVEDPIHHLEHTCLRLAQWLGAPAASGLLVVDAPYQAVPVGSDVMARELASAELTITHGPGIDTLRSGHPQPEIALTGPMARVRWPRWTAQATDRGFSAAAGFALTRQGAVLGAITVLSDQPLRVDPDRQQAARLLADAAAAGLNAQHLLRKAEETGRQLEQALISRILIEQAKGVLSERMGISPATAFTLLRNHARSRRMPIRDLADAVIEGRALREDPT
ncbi:hypothetical protein BIV57_03910 [Mangrovactinospora gilvigrisea]|uniref:ANTAR domain-containing protein n=1 Tax=Mangrovactinospora gilvigrisea TaxID=1428644 RepID=A0A1J7BJB1_9ACTN|nr:hypothetical protein BIV57_03910 [Mangrovactinospora gilvigrisea]